MADGSGKGGNKRSGAGRKRRQCTAYKSKAQREWNKMRRLVKHLKRQPGDPIAKALLKDLKRNYPILTRRLDKRAA